MMELNPNGEAPRPRVGIGILIQNQNGQVLLARRKTGALHGNGEYAFPGGHLEFGETLFEGAKREVKEETGLDVDEFKLISVNEEMRYLKTDNKHYIGLGVWAKYKGGEPQIMEPEKSESWEWFNLDHLPEKMFQGTELTLCNFKAGKIYQANHS